VEAVELSVVVPTRDRPLRLRWLLNALEEQRADFAWEVIVAHNSRVPETQELLETHPLANLRHLRLPDGHGPAALRNAGWRAARAPVVVFTDDDCRPPEDWLASTRAAVAAHPGAIVQGQTQPDPDELGILHHAPHARSQEIVPPHVMAQTCNIAYPRAVLEAAGGFDESFPSAVGEDTDLALRARAAGTPFEAAPEMLTYHAVYSGLAARLKGTWRWQHMALLVRRHPELREQLPLGGRAWNARHAWLLLAALGLLTRRPLLALPYLATTPRVYGDHPRALARTASELPGRAAIDAVETAALLYGSARHRTLLL
jgi:GT2 family glycosyltransferase